MIQLVGVAITALLAVLVAFQLALAIGAPWGRAAYGGVSHPVLAPRLRVASGIAAAVWSAVAVLVLRIADVSAWPDLPAPVLAVAAWALVGLFAVAVVANAATRSRIERAIWLPYSLVQLAGALVIAIGR